MFEALLIIWIAAGTNHNMMTTVRYPSFEQCELAKHAILSDQWSQDKRGWMRRIIDSDIHCIQVPKVNNYDEQ